MRQISFLQTADIISHFVNMIERNRLNKNKISAKNALWILSGIFLVAFVLRIFIAGLIMGHTTDIGCFVYWAEQVFQDGLTNFYNGPIVCDYPPGYIYILWLVEFFRDTFDLMFAFPAHIIILKLPAIIFDMASAYFIYKIATKRMSTQTSLLLAAVAAFNPMIILNSAAWGQVDSILTFFILLTAYNIINNKQEWATITYVIAVLLKPQAFIFAPILIFAYIRGKNLKRSLFSLLWGFLLFVAVILPFAIKQSPLWILDLYFGTMGQYAYATVNAYNIYALLGANWTADSTALFFIPYVYYGYAAIVAVCALATVAFFKNAQRPGFPYATAALLMTVVFTFTTKMHERYLFPALLLTLAAFIYSKDKRFLHLHILQSITCFANSAYILYLDNTGRYVFFSPYVAVVSALVVFTTLWFIRVYVQLYIKNERSLLSKYLL